MHKKLIYLNTPKTQTTSTSQWYGCQSLGFLMCTQMLMQAAAHRGGANTIKGSSQITCCTRESNPCQYCAWHFSSMLYQSSYPACKTDQFISLKTGLCMCVCVCEKERERESVCVCVRCAHACMWWNERIFVFVSALVSYEMGCHKWSIIIIIKQRWGVINDLLPWL